MQTAAELRRLADELEAQEAGVVVVKDKGGRPRKVLSPEEQKAEDMRIERKILREARLLREEQERHVAPARKAPSAEERELKRLRVENALTVQKVKAAAVARAEAAAEWKRTHIADDDTFFLMCFCGRERELTGVELREGWLITERVQLPPPGSRRSWCRPACQASIMAAAAPTGATPGTVHEHAMPPITAESLADDLAPPEEDDGAIDGEAPDDL